MLNPLKGKGAYLYFTLASARQFYLAQGGALGIKGLTWMKF